MPGDSWKILGILMLYLAGCSSQNIDVLAEINHLPCEQEAVQLINPVKCFVRPAGDVSGVVVLEAGRFVYLCHEHNEWVAVMYPRTGESIDCNYRSIKNQCPIGWVKNGLVTSRFD